MLNFQDKVIYQVYPKSFCDSNGDGIGDIKGITSKLDYLAKLGVDYIWSTPFFISPQNDNGYDVADYYNIDPIYGTMEDLEELILEAKKRNMGIMLDMVFNHTSTEHEWFKKAIAGDEHYKDYYIFKDAVDGNAPTNWISKFGGSAWEYCSKWNQYYLHLFDVTQADLNWKNEHVRKELINILKFWINKGITGFRFDVVNLISKPSNMENDFEGDGRRFYTDGKKVHTYLKELCKDSGIIDKSLITVGEMSSTTIENCIKYSNPLEQELSMCFNFHHLKVDYKNGQKWELMPFDFEQLKSILHSWQVGMEEQDGWNAVFWTNHDQPRAVSRFCNDEQYREVGAKMLASCIHLMRGTPYIYQGEEIGMTNAKFNDIAQYQDVESKNYFQILLNSGKTKDEAYNILQERSRDNARTPMQWDNSENAGFSTAVPWITVNPNYININVKAELEKDNSIFQFYCKLIQIRKNYSVIAQGQYIPLDIKYTKVFAYERKLGKKSLLVFNNFDDKTVELYLKLENYICILNNYDYDISKIDKQLILRPYETIVFYKD